MSVSGRRASFASLFGFIIFFSSFCRPLFADVDSRKTPPPLPNAGDVATSFNQSPQPPPPLKPDGSAIKPSVAVIVGVLTIIFSLTFLLLLYAKHCKRGGGGGADVVYNGSGGDLHNSREGGRKNSGIDRSVIESLPIFRFSSLRGQKDGLECAVCLARFEPRELLKLLPKCKHAFHVECVDTWLDAHSTCPLCRYRVDPEDILLIGDAIGNNSGSNNESDSNRKTVFLQDDNQSTPSRQQEREQGQESEKDPDFMDIESGRGGADQDSANPEFRRVSGRHSSAGERGSGFLSHFLVSHRRSGGGGGESERDPASSRRSLDGSSKKKRSEPSLAVGCFDRPYRKDGLLLTNDGTEANNMARFEHRIVVSSGLHNNQRWSDVQPSDLLYLRSEMIISDSRRFPSVSGCRSWHQNLQSSRQGIDVSGGRSVINSRSLSEITSVNRFSSNYINSRHNHRQRHAGVVSRWLAWISSQSRPAVQT